MTNGYSRPTEASDLKWVAQWMRTEDVAEVKAYSGSTPHRALMDAFLYPGATTRTICLPNGLPCGMYGVCPLPQYKRVGAIWMLAATNIKNIHRQFLRESRTAIDEIAQDYDLVFNFTDARNEVHHRWIKWAGFTFIKEHEKFGVEQRPFFEFVRIVEKQNV